MNTQDPLHVPTVNGAGLATASRALYGLLGVLLAPLVVQHVFGPRARAEAWALAGVTALGLGVALGGAVVPSTGGGRGAGSMLARSLGLATVSGALLGPAWLFLFDRPSADLWLIASVFGAFYGAMAGLGIGALYAVWSGLARRALQRPSAVSAQRLSIAAGVLLALGGTVAGVSYRFDLGQAAGVGLGVTGALVVLGAVLRTLRLSRIHAMAERGELEVQPRAEQHVAPALAWAPVIDKVIVRPLSREGVEPGPFRNQVAVEEVATMPSDTAGVGRALRRTVAIGLGALGVIAMLEGSMLLCVSSCCGGGGPCHSSAAASPCGR